MKKIILALTSVSSFAFDAVNVGIGAFDMVSLSLESKLEKGTFSKIAFASNGQFHTGYLGSYQEGIVRRLGMDFRSTAGINIGYYYELTEDIGDKFYHRSERKGLYIYPEASIGVKLGEKFHLEGVAGFPSGLSLSVRYSL